MFLFIALQPQTAQAQIGGGDSPLGPLFMVEEECYQTEGSIIKSIHFTSTVPYWNNRLSNASTDYIEIEVLDPSTGLWMGPFARTNNAPSNTYTFDISSMNLPVGVGCLEYRVIHYTYNYLSSGVGQWDDDEISAGQICENCDAYFPCTVNYYLEVRVRSNTVYLNANTTTPPAQPVLGKYVITDLVTGNQVYTYTGMLMHVVPAGVLAPSRCYVVTFIPIDPSTGILLYSCASSQKICLK